MSHLLSKKELIRQIKAFLSDHNRGISIALFAELCGLSDKTIKEVFIYERMPLTENVQIRVNKGYNQLKQGNVKIMQRPDRSRYVAYRRESQPVIEPSMGLKVTSEGIKLKIGPRNRHDYSELSLDDVLRG